MDRRWRLQSGLTCLLSASDGSALHPCAPGPLHRRLTRSSSTARHPPLIFSWLVQAPGALTRGALPGLGVLFSILGNR